LLIVDCLRH